jgi:uncharacterized protein (TIGR00290 family)
MKAFMNWSGGKDSAFSLYKIKDKRPAIGALVTTMNARTQRVTMHGVRRSLLEKQAEAAGLPLVQVDIGDEPGIKTYEDAIHESNERLKREGYTHVVSGDLFLEDLRAYKEGLYQRDGLEMLFPIWKMDSKLLLEEFLNAGFRAVVICVNGKVLDQSFCGRELDRSFIEDLPEGVDPCGENGEYHSFVFDGPIFSEPIEFEKGGITFRKFPAPKLLEDGDIMPQRPDEGFYFCELLPV